MNLREDIAEMFGGLDGRDRYMERLASYCEWVKERKRDDDREYRHRNQDRLRRYYRDYARNRYQTDPAFRLAHKEAMTRYKDRLLGANRKRRFYGPIAVKHGTYRGYQSLGCRCTECRKASAAYQRDRRARLAQQRIA